MFRTTGHTPWYEPVEQMPAHLSTNLLTDKHLPPHQG